MHLKVTWSVTLLLAAIWVQAISSSYDQKGKRAVPSLFPEKYAIIMDAGSSGTRIKVYEYTEGEHDPIEVSDIEQVEVPDPDKVEPGLSEMVHFIDQIEDYLGDLIESAKKVVPPEKQPITPINLFATAGMRLLPKDEQDAVINEVNRLLSDKKFCPFRYKNGSAAIISGEREAAYGWITVNFLKGVFSSGYKGETYGALDLGGASTQNSFKVQKKNKAIPPTYVHTIDGKEYAVYAHSYLGYGANEARDNFIEYLSQRKRLLNKLLISPCHNNKYRKLVTINEKKYLLLGKYNGKRCKAYIKEKFFCKNCPLKNQPELSGNFYGFSVFYYALHDSGITKTDDEVVPLPKIRFLSDLFCSKNNAFTLDKDIYDVYNLCFRLNYLYELLHDGYNTNRKTLVLHVANELYDFDLNWTLGAVLYTNKII